MAAFERALWHKALKLFMFCSHREKKWKILISLCFFTWWFPKILIIKSVWGSHRWNVSNLKANWNQDPKTRQFFSFSMSPSLIEKYLTIVHFILLTWSKITSYGRNATNFHGVFQYLGCTFIAESSPFKRHDQTLVWQSFPSLAVQGRPLISQGSTENLWSFNTWIAMDWWMETMAVKTRADSSFFPGCWEGRIISNIWSSWIISAFYPFFVVFFGGDSVCPCLLFSLQKTQTKTNRYWRQNPLPLEFTHAQVFS